MSNAETTVICEILTSVSEFQQVTASWDQLYERARCTVPALHSSAVRSYLLHRTGTKSRPVIVTAWRSGQLIGGLPLIASAFGKYVNLATFSDVHTYGVEFLADPDVADLACQRIVEFLIQAFPNLFSLRIADARAERSHRLGKLMAGVALPSVEIHRRASYYIVPPKSEDPTRHLSSNFRKNLRKQQARLRAFHDVRVDFLTPSEAHDDQFDRFLALEASGWKGRAGTALAQQKKLSAYYRDLLVGQLEWHLLTVDDQLIAAHVAVRHCRTITLLKIAYDERYAQCGPGNLLMLELINHESAKQSTDEIDCITDMPWHQSWRMAQREYASLTLYPRRLYPIVFGYLPDRVKQGLRRVALARAVARWLRKHRGASGLLATSAVE